MTIIHTKSQERKHMPVTLGQGKWSQDDSRILTVRVVSSRLVIEVQVQRDLIYKVQLERERQPLAASDLHRCSHGACAPKHTRGHTQII